MFGFLKRKPKKDEPSEAEREQADREEAARREGRRKAAERRVMDAMRASRAARQGIEAAELDAQATVALTRQETDTAVRRVQEHHSEISGVFPPPSKPNGRHLADEPATAEPEAEHA